MDERGDISVRFLSLSFGILVLCLAGIGHAIASCDGDATWCRMTCINLPDAPSLSGFISGKDTQATMWRRNKDDCESECTQKYNACVQSARREHDEGRTSPNPLLSNPPVQESRSPPICSGGGNASRGLPGEAPSRNDFVAAEKAMKAKDSLLAYKLLRKIDEEGTAAIAKLAPSLPWRDVIISKQLDILSWARAKLAVFYDRGIAIAPDDSEAAKWYQKSLDTTFVDEARRCKIVGYPGAMYVVDYATMFIYGRGVAKSEQRARELLAHGYGATYGDALLVVMDHHALPKTYDEFQHTNISALAARLRR